MHSALAHVWLPAAYLAVTIIRPGLFKPGRGAFHLVVAASGLTVLALTDGAVAAVESGLAAGAVFALLVWTRALSRTLTFALAVLTAIVPLNAWLPLYGAGVLLSVVVSAAQVARSSGLSQLIALTTVTAADPVGHLTRELAEVGKTSKAQVPVLVLWAVGLGLSAVLIAVLGS